MTAPAFYQWQGEKLILQIHVQPRARRDELCGLHGEALKIRITAPPADGKANRHLQKYLASLFGVPASRITLLRGTRSRHKQFCIEAPEKLPEIIPPRGAGD